MQVQKLLLHFVSVVYILTQIIHLSHEELMKILLKPANEPEANAIKSI